MAFTLVAVRSSGATIPRCREIGVRFSVVAKWLCREVRATVVPAKIWDVRRESYNYEAVILLALFNTRKYYGTASYATVPKRSPRYSYKSIVPLKFVFVIVCGGMEFGRSATAEAMVNNYRTWARAAAHLNDWLLHHHHLCICILQAQASNLQHQEWIISCCLLTSSSEDLGIFGDNKFNLHSLIVAHINTLVE